MLRALTIGTDPNAPWTIHSSFSPTTFKNYATPAILADVAYTKARADAAKAAATVPPPPPVQLAATALASYVVPVAIGGVLLAAVAAFFIMRR